MRSRVYVRTDGQNRITRIEGEYTLPRDLTGWTLVEEGESCDRLNLAQSHYLEGGLKTEDGIYRWKYADGACVPRSEAEIEADRAAHPPAPPTETEQLRADVDFIAAMAGVIL